MTALALERRATLTLLLLLGATALSWSYVLAIEPHGMDVGVLLRPRSVAGSSEMKAAGQGVDEMGMDDAGSRHASSGMGAGSGQMMTVLAFLAGWVVMMAAMMMPAVAPLVMLVARWSRSQGQPAYRLVPFVAGYLAVWGAAGALYYVLIEALSSLVPSSGAGVRIAAAVLLAAGLYQFVPLKERCLTACRTPLGFLMTHGGRMSRGSSGYLEVGARHGLFCLGCCWMLMVILVVLGVMNIVWMLAVAGVIFVEKVTGFGAGFSKVMGAGFAAAGLALVIAPGLIV
ncbi:MAG: DUF2182 domain-containing protein [Actinomycetota bacterium]|nr:DUF2182 domain-containing protein [Actinomycetota bacterium]